MVQTTLFVHALTPLHPGSGTALDVIDLPIAREKTTSLPYHASSGIKGGLRAYLRTVNAITESKWLAAFGPESESASDHAGSLVFSDARLLFFPVRADRGVFAWTTCPFVLQRFGREVSGAPLPAEAVGQMQAFVAAESVLTSGSRLLVEDLVLETPVEPQEATQAKALMGTISDYFAPKIFPTTAEQASFRRRVALVSDDAFVFLAQTATEIQARIRMDPRTRTAARTGLWYEEHLPAESILASLVLALPSRARGSSYTDQEMQQVLHSAHGKSITLGGKETVGRGRVRLMLC